MVMVLPFLFPAPPSLPLRINNLTTPSSSSLSSSSSTPSLLLFKSSSRKTSIFSHSFANNNGVNRFDVQNQALRINNITTPSASSASASASASSSSSLLLLLFKSSSRKTSIFSHSFANNNGVNRFDAQNQALRINNITTPSSSSSSLSSSLSLLLFKSSSRKTSIFSHSFANNNGVNRLDAQNQTPRRSLFPGGFKRAEIKLPNLVLQLSPDEVLSGQNVIDLVDQAVSKWIGIVVLNEGGGSSGSGSGSGSGGSGGGRLYEAACLLKSVVKNRAYFMVSERVDIAAAVNATGVVLSDQGLPAIVARNTMMDSKSDSVVLPLVARIVQSADAALSASNSEGADFLIYNVDEEKPAWDSINSVLLSVKIPIFVMFVSSGNDTSFAEASTVFNSGASGFVLSLKDLGLFRDDTLKNMFTLASASTINQKTKLGFGNFNTEKSFLSKDNGVYGEKGVTGFIGLEDREKRFIEREKSILIGAINIIQKAAPLMEEVSLLNDAVSQLDEPFLLAIVGEFNSGKSTVINALLGRRYLKEGVVPTTNEITFLCYSELGGDELQRCERHPDGQYICYLPAPILKDMNIVDTPGTNVILQRQQRLTEEFVPRADLLLFVISADRPLTESEVAFLRYIQQWKKKVVFVLNKSDLYQNASELEEAVSFIKDNTKKLLNSEQVALYPVSARAALEAKLSASYNIGKGHQTAYNGFYELERFLYSFLDGSTSTGMERMKLKLETPIGIAEQLLYACETLVRQDCRCAKQDLVTVNETISSVEQFAAKMESESLSWRRQILSLIDSTKARVLKLIESTVTLSNLDLVTSYVFKGDNPSTMPANSAIRNDIIGPALSDAQKLLGEYALWLQSSNAREGRLYKESFEKRWPLIVHPGNEVQLETYELLRKVDEVSVTAIENFSAKAASKLFEQELREVFLGTFGGLGAAGLSASLLTSVLPTTLEDLLALGLCSAGGYLAISNFPVRRQKLVEKVTRAADALSRELENSMQQDLSETIRKLKDFVKIISGPYHDAAQQKLDSLLDVQDELSVVGTKLQKLQIEIQNLHIS